MTGVAGSSLQQYVKSITDPETLEYRFSTIQDVLLEIQLLEVRRAEGKGNEVLRVFTSFISFIERYSKAVDMMAQYNASPSCLIWGCLRVVLRVGQSLPYYFRDLLCIVDRFGSQLSLFCRYDSLFHGSEDFRSVLSDTYLDALVFLREARDTLRVNGSIVVWMKRAWINPEDRFADIFGRLGHRLEFLSLLSALLHREVVHRDLEKQAQFREATSRTLDLVLSNPSRQDRLRRDIISWLGPVDYMEDSRRNKEKRAPGTCQWIFDHPAFKIWTQNPSQRVGWAYGAPGMGKTVLCGSVIEHLGSKATTEASHPPTIGYFFFDGADETRNNMLAMFRAILSQLVDQHPSCTECLEPALLAATTRHNRTHMTWLDRPSALLQRVLAKTNQTFILVDGLDECKDTGSSLTEFLDAITASTNCRAIFFSRDLQTIRDTLSSCWKLCITKTETGQDISTFFSNVIQTCGIPRGQNEETIVSQLSAHADGMFLWAHFMSQELMSATCPDDVVEAAVTTPPGLQLHYSSFLRNLTAKPPKWLNLARNVFLWVVCSPRPLTWPELQCCLSLSSGEAGDPPTRHYGRLPYKSAVLKVYQPFIEYYPDGDYFRLAHVSVHQFLTRPDDCGNDSGDGLRVSTSTGHGRMAGILLKYLCQPELPDGRTLESKAHPLLSYATSYWGHHFLLGKPDAELRVQATSFLSIDDRRRRWLMRWLLMDRDGFPLAKILRVLKEVRSRLQENTSGDDVWYDELQDVVEILVQLDEMRLRNRDSNGNTPMPSEVMSTSHRIMIIRDLARSYKLAGRLDDGISHFQAGLARIEGIPEAAAAAAGAWLLNGLGILYDQQGRVDLAIETQERALALQQHASPDLDAVLTTNELGRLRRHRGEFGAARALHKRALAALRAAAPPHDVPDVQELWTLSHLAKTHRAVGDTSAALALHAEVLAARSRLLGADHPHALWDASDVAKCHAALGDAAAACRVQAKAVRRREAVLGPAHHDTLWAVNDLALMCEAAGRLGEALRLHTRAWEGQARTLGAEHATTRWSLDEVRRLRGEVERCGD